MLEGKCCHKDMQEETNVWARRALKKRVELARGSWRANQQYLGGEICPAMLQTFSGIVTQLHHSLNNHQRWGLK